MQTTLKFIEFPDSEEETVIKALLLAPEFVKQANQAVKITDITPAQITYEQADKLRTEGYKLHNGINENGKIIPAFRSYSKKTGKLVQALYCISDNMHDSADGTPYWLCFNEQSGALEKAVSCKSTLPNEEKPDHAFAELSEDQVVTLRASLEIA